MKIRLLRFLKYFLPFTFLLMLFQYFIVNYFGGEKMYYSIFSVYAFHFFSTFIIYFLLLLVHDKFQDKTGFAFMGAGLLKMFAAVLFLLPMLLAKVAHPFANVLAFFIPYFLFLIFETFFAVRLINSK
ncbi:hypothetical protein RM553_04820 [Zunongwangia sp. F363]|uniref:ATP synthase protein I n=1 Tax=Autumnicola tepida TaxID=3075595 RepID=A0ABU3C765_9FLAO|nr:hypothetical protein [Zunongwangia sp. F363]MDT0642149.1 hypothetical protein [Zunongwangia sp. F363]